MVRLWQSKRWLERKYIVDKLTIQEIADLAGTNKSTISRALKKFNIKVRK